MVSYGLPGWLRCKEAAFNAGEAGYAVPSLGQEDPTEEETATHSGTLA